MWGKLSIVSACWLASLAGVIKLFHALPPGFWRRLFLNDSVTMILAGCSLLLLAMAIKKFSLFFLQKRSNRKYLTDAHRREPGLSPLHRKATANARHLTPRKQF